jgi:glycosyltransferase involved in cell wall biosynthesis
MGLFYWNLKKVAKLYIKNNEKPDIILASSVHPLTLIAGIQIGKKYKIPCICEIRDLWPEAIFWFNKSKEKTLLGKLLVLGEHWIYRNADALIFTKEGDTDYIKEKKWDKLQGGDIDLSKAYYINNGIDKKQYDTLKEQVYQDDDLENNKFKVIYAGAIRPINNVGMIIDTAKELEEQDVEFLIYGDGNEREKLEKRVQDENIKNVKFKGLVSKEKIPYILSKGSINLLNYSATQYNWARGNSSNKLFEYMASGKPIISNVKMGYSILNKYKCGIELDNPNSKELAQEILKIKNLSKEEYEKMGKNGIEGSKDFDFSILTEKLIRIIESFEDIL